MKKKIAFISQPEYFRFIYEHDLETLFEVREFPFNFNMQANEFDDLLEFNADYNIFFRGEFFPTSVLDKIKGKKIALSSEPFPRKINGKWYFTMDSINRYLTFRNIRNCNFDYVFHYDKSSMSLFKKDGLFLSGEFVFPVARNTYFPKDFKKKWDIFFIGRSTEHREKFFGPLKHKFNFLHIAHGIHGNELSEYINKSIICINAHAEDEISWEPRMQMMLASGAFVISEKITPNDYLKPGIDFIEYSSPVELYDKVSHALRDNKQREEIIKNSQLSIDKYFNSQIVFRDFLKKIDNGEFESFKCGREYFIFKFINFILKNEKRVLSTIKIKLGILDRLFKNSKKEFKRNGFIGVVRRSLSMFGINYTLLDDVVLFIVKIKNILFSKEKIYGRNAKIAYVIPGVKISGGVAVVLNHVNLLKKRGYNVCLITLSEETNIDWFLNEVEILSALRESRKEINKIDTMIATHWSTAFYVNSLNAARKMYFVQSDERRFNPENRAEINSINATYKMRLEFFTEAKWIQRWLNDEFNKDAYYVPNGLDCEIFSKNCDIVKSNKKPRVLIEGPIDFWFKGMDDAYEAIKDIDCEIWIISSHGKPKEGWRYDRFFENVPMNKMKEIYSSCDIFLKMSYMEGFFGPPLEAMACGCAVIVGKVTGYDEYIENGINALVVDQGDIEAAREAVVKLISDSRLRLELIRNGYKTSNDWKWDYSIDLLEKVMNGDEVVKYYTEKFPENYNYKKEIIRLQKIKKQKLFC